MERLGFDAQAGEFAGHLFSVFAAQAVDDAALVTVQVDELNNLPELLMSRGTLHNVEGDVRTVKRTDEQSGIRNVELCGDVVAGDAVGGGGERHHGDVGIALLESA